MATIFGNRKGRSSATEGKGIQDDYNQNVKPSSDLDQIGGRGGELRKAKDRSLATDLDGGPRGISQEKTIGNNVPQSAATDKKINN
jgi:hypothetical protein